MSQASVPPGFTTASELSEIAVLAQSVKTLRLAKEAPHEDLLAFLSIAQELDVSLLPLVWYPNQVGRGGFSILNENLVHAQLSLVFKRMSDTAKLNETRRVLNPSITELVIAAHEDIKDHPNILSLDGICWEVTPEQERIFPVMVFEKFKHGDLYQFRNSSHWSSVGLTEKLSLMVDIIRGLHTLHSCNIQHGDIKPQNILISESQYASFSAKLCDFSSSSICESEDSLCFPPTSSPWTAPEHHHRGHIFREARKLDIFGVGLVMIWMIMGLPHEKLDSKSSTRLISVLRSSDHIIDDARKIVEALETDQKTKQTLYLCLEKMLCLPHNRWDSLGPMLAIWEHNLNGERPVKLKPVIRPKTHCSFSISYSLFPLVSTNYLVRRLLLRCFEQKVQFSTCRKCKRNVAFQAAFCYYIGFGESRSVEKAEKCAKLSGRSWEDVEDEVDEVSTFTFAKESRRFPRLGLSGFSMVMDHVNEYHKSGYDIDAVKEIYRREIRDFDAVFVHETLLSAALKTTLANLLSPIGASAEAEELYKNVIKVFEESAEHGPSDRATLSCKCRLAHWLSLQRRLEEAEELIHQVLAENQEENNSETIEYHSTLGAILYHAERLEDATTVFLKTLEMAKSILGIHHIQTLHVMTNIACCYRDAGLLDKAEEYDKAALSAKRRVLDDHEHSHASTLSSAANLALTYSRQGRWAEAQPLEEWVLEERIKYGGEQDPATLTAKYNLSVTYFSSGKPIEEAYGMCKSTLEARKYVIGQFHPDTLVNVEMLAKMLISKEEIGSAGELLDSVIHHEQFLQATKGLSIGLRLEQLLKSLIE
jgi:serine/threonine protein kinase